MDACIPNKFRSLSVLTSAVLILCLAAGFVVPRVLAFLPGLFGLVLSAALFWQTRRCPKPGRMEMVVIAVTLCLAGTSAFWAVNPEFALERTGKIALILLPALLFMAVFRSETAALPACIVRILAGMHILAGLVFAGEYMMDFPIFRFVMGLDGSVDVRRPVLNRSLVVFSLTFLPVLFMVCRLETGRVEKGLIVALMTVSAAAALFQADSQTAQMAWILALLAFFLFPYRLKSAWVVLGILIVVLSAAAPWVIKPVQQILLSDYVEGEIEDRPPSLIRQASIPHRFDVWNFAASKVLEKPLTGHGIGAMRFLEADEWMPFQKADTVLHPHNIVLQIWVEFGVLGLLPASLFFLYMIYRMNRIGGQNSRLGLAVFLSVLCMASTGYGLWQSWQLGLFVILTVLTGLAFKAGTATPRISCSD